MLKGSRDFKCPNFSNDCLKTSRLMADVAQQDSYLLKVDVASIVAASIHLVSMAFSVFKCKGVIRLMFAIKGRACF